MEKIDRFRQAIDGIDDEILELLNKRASLVVEIGNLKKGSGQPLYVPSRELSIFERLGAGNTGPFPTDAIRNVFREIISASLSLEELQKVAYLGPAGTFTHLAGIKNFGLSAKLIPLRSIDEVFSEVEKRRCDFGIIPIENSLEGVVNHTIDMFMDSTLTICGEVFTEVNHNLMNKSGKSEDIKTIYSHPQAIAQCKGWLSKKGTDVTIVESPSTARAAEIASKDFSAAAISSEAAEILYNLRIVDRNIEDYRHNLTRFLVIGNIKSARTGNDKTSIMFSVMHTSGSLFKALTPFAEDDINLTKIESRPSKRKAWDYIFFVDIDGHLEDNKIKNALDNFSKNVSFLKILGSYPRGII